MSKIKIVGFMHSTGVYNDRPYDNVKIQTAEMVCPLSSEPKPFYDKATKKQVGSGATSGRWLSLTESKIPTSDALRLFGVKSFEELVEFIGMYVDIGYNRLGSVKYIDVLTDTVTEGV